MESTHKAEINAITSEYQWESLKSIFFSMEDIQRFTDCSFPNNLDSIIDNNSSKTHLINSLINEIEFLKTLNIPERNELLNEKYGRLAMLKDEEYIYSDFRKKIINLKNDIHFVRISDFTNDSYGLINNPSPQDIIQGSVGNCYFLSVCSAISNYPHLLNKIFETKHKNYSGIYCLNFYIDGEKKKIIVDDYIPVLKYNNQPIFSHINPKTKNIWPLIIEKAWAKLHGSYQKTSGGLPSYPFDVLLGVPCEDINLHSEINNIEELNESKYINETPFIDIEECVENKNFLIWEKLLSFYHNNYLITCSISDKLEERKSMKQELDDLGLVTRHAYTCLFFQEFENKISNDKNNIYSNSMIKLVKLRNPWGKLKNKNFKGKLKQNNFYNNEEIMINTQINDEGEFILEFDEFKRFFGHIYVSKIKNNYNCCIDSIYYNDNFNKNSSIMNSSIAFSLMDKRACNPNSNQSNTTKLDHFYAYLLDLSCFDKKNNKSSLFISLCKPANYFEKWRDIKSELFYKSHIFVGKIQDNSITYIDDAYSNYYSSDIEIGNIQEGKYIIFCLFEIDPENEIFFQTDPNKKLGILKIYSNQEFLILERLNPKEFRFHFIFDYLIYDLYYKKFSNVEKQRKYILGTNDKSIFLSTFRINKYSKFIVLAFENKKNDANVIIEFALTNSKTLCLSDFVEYDKKENKIVKLIPHGNTFLCTFYGNYFSYSYKHKIIYSKEEIKRKCKKEGDKYKFKDIDYIVYIKDPFVCFNFTNNTNRNYLLTLTINNIHDFEDGDLQNGQCDLYSLQNSDEYLILKLKNFMSFSKNQISLNYSISDKYLL